jgi:hypothetical protein
MVWCACVCFLSQVSQSNDRALAVVGARRGEHGECTQCGVRAHVVCVRCGLLG